jgi:GNAT superfamily N-acetyltransferase
MPKAAAKSTAKGLHFRAATLKDAAELAALHTTVADHLTGLHGKGVWSFRMSEKGARLGLRTSKMFVFTEGGKIVATFRFTTKKPWAIDVSYFTSCEKPLYLVGMAVRPDRQRQGLGRKCLAEAVRIAKAWPADAIRLDAFDSAAGAGAFYARCGFAERGRTSYRGNPLIYFELLLR